MENKQKVENVNDHEETKYQPEEKENVDPEATTSKEVSPYYWVQQPTAKGINKMITMCEDIDELSIYMAGETLFKSHVYTALGALFYEGTSMIVWIDYPLCLVKNRAVRKETRRIYWGEPMKLRPFFMLESCGDHLGLSPAMQEMKIKSDDTLKQYGLLLKKDRFDFTEEWDQDIRYLELDICEVVKEPIKKRLMDWLNMHKESEREEMDRVIEELKRRVEKKNEAGAKGMNAE